MISARILRGVVAALAFIALFAAGSPVRAIYPNSATAYTHPVSWAGFGPVQVTAYPPRGRVVVLDTDACDRSSLPESLPALNTPTSLTCEDTAQPTCLGAQTRFGAAVVVRRGVCSFTTKARNVQDLKTMDGWPVVAVLVANESPRDELIFMSDDGEGKFVQIVTVLITYYTKRELVRLAQSKVPLLLEFGVSI